MKEELDRHLNLLPRCRERNPDEAVLSFLDSLWEELEDELKSPDGGCMHSRYIDEAHIHFIRKMAKDIIKMRGTSNYFYKLLMEYFS